MKTITKISFILMFGIIMPIFSQTPIFEERFSYVTDIWYGGTNYVIPDNEFDLYCDNPGWSGFTVSLGAPTDPESSTAIPFNEIAKPRVGNWKQAAYITTPTINCPNAVVLSFRLRRVARSTSLTGTWDEPNVNILHAADGENFSLLQTVSLPKQVAFSPFEINVSGATADSKFQFACSTTVNPNRFFIDSVFVTPDNTTEMSQLRKENVYVKKLISNDILTVYMPDISQFESAYVYNLNGNCILHTIDKDIPLTTLSKGFYMIRINTVDGKARVLKFER